MTLRELINKLEAKSDSGKNDNLEVFCEDEMGYFEYEIKRVETSTDSDGDYFVIKTKA